MGQSSLAQLRHENFVGRESELEVLEQVLAAPGNHPAISYVWGPPGIGKSELLRELSLRLEKQGFLTLWSDCSMETAECVQEKLAALSQSEPSANRRPLLLLDKFSGHKEAVACLLDGLLSKATVPPRIAISSRFPPSSRWHLHLGLQDHFHAIELGALEATEVEVLLGRWTGRSELVDDLRRYGHGDPLYLTLASNLCTTRTACCGATCEEPDFVQAYLERLLLEVPSPRHRRALEVAAVVYRTTAEVLKAVLEDESSDELFDWLQSRSFLRRSREGVIPTATARRILLSDLRWRTPSWLNQIAAKAILHTLDRDAKILVDASRAIAPTDPLDTVLSLFYPRRLDPTLARVMQFAEPDALTLRPIGPEHRDEVDAILTRHEGKASAAILSEWIDRKPESTNVCLDTDGRVGGFMTGMGLSLEEARAATWDPLVASIGEEESHRNREGSPFRIVRFLASKDDYQEVSQVQTHLLMGGIAAALQSPAGMSADLSASYLVLGPKTSWPPPWLEEIKLPEGSRGEERRIIRIPWSGAPVGQTLVQLVKLGVERLFAERAVQPATSRPIYERSDFEPAVKAGLGDINVLGRLVQNPLIRSCAIDHRVEKGASDLVRAAALSELLKNAIDDLGNDPRWAKAQMALEAIYLDGAASQERAALEIGIPLSTFRRHLKRGVADVVEWLWRMENGIKSHGQSLARP